MNYKKLGIHINYRNRHAERDSVPIYNISSSHTNWHSKRRSLQSTRFLSGWTYSVFAKSMSTNNKAQSIMDWRLGRWWRSWLAWFRDRSAVKRLLFMGIALIGLIYVRGTTAIEIWTVWWWIWIILTCAVAGCIGWVANDEHRKKHGTH